MLNKNNIEELFKSGLENLESPVPTDVWVGIETNLSASGGASAITGIAKSILTKVAIGVVSIGAISYGVYHFTNTTNNNEVITEVSPEVKDNTLNVIEANQTQENNSQVSIDESTEITIDNKQNIEEISTTPESKSFPKSNINKPNNYIPTSTGNNSSNNTTDNSNNSNSVSDNNKNNSNNSASNENANKPIPAETKTAPFTIEVLADETEGKIPFEASLKLDKSASNIIWTLPNGKEISSAELNHTFEKLGKHTIKVKAINKEGETATNEITINVLPTSFIKLPNPVGNTGVRQLYANGTNKFNIEFENVAEVEGVVWDLKGNEVYKFNTIEGAKWDGKNMMGNNCEQGVYFMMIKAVGFDGYPAKPERISINLTR